MNFFKEPAPEKALPTVAGLGALAVLLLLVAVTMSNGMFLAAWQGASRIATVADTAAPGALTASTYYAAAYSGLPAFGSATNQNAAEDAGNRTTTGYPAPLACDYPPVDSTGAPDDTCYAVAYNDAYPYSIYGVFSAYQSSDPANGFTKYFTLQGPGRHAGIWVKPTVYNSGVKQTTPVIVSDISGSPAGQGTYTFDYWLNGGYTDNKGGSTNIAVSDAWASSVRTPLVAGPGGGQSGVTVPAGTAVKLSWSCQPSQTEYFEENFFLFRHDTYAHAVSLFDSVIVSKNIYSSLSGPRDGVVTVTPSVTTTYTVQCNAAAHTLNPTATKKDVYPAKAGPVLAITVSVVLAPTAKLTAPTSPIAYGAAATLSWTSTHASYCSITYPGGTLVASGSTSGSASTGALTASRTYTLTCFTATNLKATDTKTVAVNVPSCPTGYTGTYPNCVPPSCPTGYTGTYPNCVPPPSASLNIFATPNPITYNTSTRVTWSATNVQPATCSAYYYVAGQPVVIQPTGVANGSGNTGNLTANGTVIELDCKDLLGAWQIKQSSVGVGTAPVATAQLQVNTGSGYGSSATVTAPGSANFSWNSVNTQSCSINTGGAPWSGPTSGTNGSASGSYVTSTSNPYTYTLSCIANSGLSNPAPSSVHVTVSTPVGCPAGQHIEAGVCVLNVRDCSPQPANGKSTQVWDSVTGWGVCTITCDPNYNLVNGQCVAPNISIVSFTANPARVHAGSTSNLYWQINNFASGACTITSNPSGLIKNSDSTYPYRVTTASGPATTLAITQTTDFALSCGAGGSSKATVTIVPTYIEI